MKVTYCNKQNLLTIKITPSEKNDIENELD